MKKHVFVIVRFSVIQPGSGAWNSSSVNVHEMKEKIFNPDRLSFRFNTFEKFCLQSLVDQKIGADDNIKFTLIVLFSDAMPEKFKEKLTDLAHSFNKLSLYGNMEVSAIRSTLNDDFQGSFKNMNEAIKNSIHHYAKIENPNSECSFATIRLDDDDALSDNFIIEVGKYLSPAMIGMCISFPYGFEGYVDPINYTIEDIRHCYFPKVAVGLAYINLIKNGDIIDKKTFHVLNTNNHTKVDERYPVILDSRMPMYFKSLSLTNDSNGSPYLKFLPKVLGRKTLEKLPCLSDKVINLLNEEPEDFLSLEISKKASHSSAMISGLNYKLTLLRNKK